MRKQHKTSRAATASLRGGAPAQTGAPAHTAPPGSIPIGGACKARLPQTPAQRRAEVVFHALCVFLICGFVGWVYETLLIRLAEGFWQARGFLFIMQPLAHYFPALGGSAAGKIPLVWGLPIVQIYGFGGAVLCLAFRRIACHPVRVFFTGLVAMTAIELAASYFCQYVLHQVYWDYSAYPLNFQGRISAYSALAWGILSVLAVKLVGPAITRFYNRENCSHKHFHALIGALFAYVLLCNLVKYVLAPGIVPYNTPT